MTPAEDLPAGDARLDKLRSARSFLFIPGDRPERFDKAAAAGADAVIIDLEDAVGADQKAAARQATVRWLSRGGVACVRVNAAGSADYDADVAALAGLDGLLAVVLPKAADPVTVSSVAARTGAGVIALVESASGMELATSLARAQGVVRLAFGHLDYAVDLGADNGRPAMLHARSMLVLASRAAGLPGPLDGVTVSLDDPAGLDEDLAHARDLGMTGKMLIHPRQVAATHAAYQPPAKETAWAQTVLDAVTDGNGGAVRLDAEMVDAPVIARARAILRRTER